MNSNTNNSSEYSIHNIIHAILIYEESLNFRYSIGYCEMLKYIREIIYCNNGNYGNENNRNKNKLIDSFFM